MQLELRAGQRVRLGHSVVLTVLEAEDLEVRFCLEGQPHVLEAVEPSPHGEGRFAPDGDPPGQGGPS